jgi:hypothetical protein
MKLTFRRVLPVLALMGLITAGLFATMSSAAGPQGSANGQGTLDNGARKFAFSARTYADGSAKGQAILHNSAFQGTHGNAYQLQIDITCMKVIGNIATFGGTVKRTNDPSLVDAVFFTVQDNGEPGKGVDKISRVFFWDDDPNTTGDPATCQLVNVGDFPMEEVIRGNINVH